MNRVFRFLKEYKWFILAFILILSSAHFQIANQYNRQKEEYAAFKADELRTSVQAITNTFASLSQMVFDTTLNQPEVLEIMASASTGDEAQQTEAREALWNELSGTYEYLQEWNFRQLHFHLPDNTSFLRFHSPEYFGDDLSGIRYSVSQANATLQPVRGFEEGLINNGFRFVYPLLSNNTHVGSVEASIAFTAIESELESLLQGEFDFLIQTDLVETTISSAEQTNYIPSDLSSEYSYDVEVHLQKTSDIFEIDSEIIEQINAAIAPSISEGLSLGETISTDVRIDKTTYLVILIPVQNIAGEHVAYVISYNIDPVYNQIPASAATSHLASTIQLSLIFTALFLMRRADLRMRHSRDQLKAIMDHMDEGVVLVNNDATVRFANPHAQEILQVRIDPAKPPLLFDVFRYQHHGKIVPPERCPFCRSVRGGKPFFSADGFELMVDERLIPIEISCTPIFEGQKITGGVLVFQDISARIVQEKALRASEARFRNLAEHSPDTIYIKDVSLKQTLYLNRSNLFGYSVSEVDTPGFYKQVLHPDDLQTVKENWHTLLSGQDPEPVEFRWRTKEGSYEWVQRRSTILSRDHSGETEQILETMTLITERKKIEMSLLEAKLAAESAAVAKSEFLANMSHEIRTPLNAVIGISELLLDTPLTEEQQDLTLTLKNSGDMLLDLINNILDISKIEAGKMELSQEPFELHQLLADTVNLFAHKATEKGLQVLYSIEPCVPKVICGDPTRLRQILVNLLGNALKFTDRGEIIVEVEQLNLSAERKNLCFRVTDSGIGIDREDQKKLFQTFMQVDSSLTRKFGGTGLGLAICQYLVTMMQGTISVTSTPGKGSTFSFQIPFDEPAEKIVSTAFQSSELEGREIQVISEMESTRKLLMMQLKSWGMKPVFLESPPSVPIPDQKSFLAILDMSTHGSEEFLQQLSNTSRQEKSRVIRLYPKGQKQLLLEGELAFPIIPSHLYNSLLETLDRKPDRSPNLHGHVSIEKGFARKHPLSILLVEDNLINQKIAGEMLRRMGYDIVIASSGMEALDRVAEQTFDLVLMDIQMPGMGGVRTAQRIRETVPDAIPSIVALTAHALSGDREHFLAQGMDGYLSKPVRIQDLMETLIQCSSRKGKSSISHDRGVSAIVDREPEGKPKSASDSLIDRDLINAYLHAIDPDSADVVIEIIDLLTQDMPERLKDLQSAVESQDLEVVQRIAHTLKGEVSHFGARPLMELCMRIELQAKEGRNEKLMESCQEIEMAADQFLKAILEYRAEISN